MYYDKVQNMTEIQMTRRGGRRVSRWVKVQVVIGSVERIDRDEWFRMMINIRFKDYTGKSAEQ